MASSYFYVIYNVYDEMCKGSNSKLPMSQKAIIAGA